MRCRVHLVLLQSGSDLGPAGTRLLPASAADSAGVAGTAGRAPAMTRAWAQVLGPAEEIAG